MDKFRQLLFSFEGRITRKTFWIYTIIMLVLSVVLAFILSALFGITPFYLFGSIPSYGQPINEEIIQQVMSASRKSEWAWFLSGLVFLIPMAAIYIKRRHDRGATGYEYWVNIAFSTLLSLLGIMGIIYKVEENYGWFEVSETTFGLFLLVIMLIITIYMIILAGFLKGDKGENAYGKDPLEE